ncbi:metallophosphoesterase family protein [Aeoliella sp.]|uniref:metallophosphoesterase family protein n=1 Tax=Aeoliella sp. TaxID=2795800 RepID=UPI003CCBA0C6
MPTTWFTADTHLGHGNIVKFCLRPFLSETEKQQATEDPRGAWKVSPESIARHDAAIIDAINAVVEPADTLWVLGDFCWGKLEEAQAYRNRIACRDVRLVWGNHDHRSVGAAFRQPIDQGMVRVDGHKIWLNHYPMRSWHKSFHGSWHLYGHVHGRLDQENEQSPWLLARDVGVDSCDYKPVSIDDLRRYMAPREKAFAERRTKVIEHDESGSSAFIERGSLA